MAKRFSVFSFNISATEIKKPKMFLSFSDYNFKDTVTILCFSCSTRIFLGTNSYSSVIKHQI